MFGNKKMQIIKGLDEILLYLFSRLLDRYTEMFPTQSRQSSMQRAGVVLNELVIENLRGDDVEFRRDHAEFIDKEKKEVMLIDNIRACVLDFLAAKGGLYQCVSHPSATIWISGAKKVDSNVVIPDTLKKVKLRIETCIARCKQTEFEAFQEMIKIVTRPQ